MDFESRQIIDRSLDHGFDSRSVALFILMAGAFLPAKNGFHCLDIDLMSEMFFSGPPSEILKAWRRGDI